MSVDPPHRRAALWRELKARILDLVDNKQVLPVWILDEAQNLPLTLLEEVRILSDLEGRERLLQVVLVGQPELRDHLKLPEMRQVNQRVTVRCELTPARMHPFGFSACEAAVVPRAAKSACKSVASQTRSTIFVRPSPFTSKPTDGV